MLQRHGQLRAAVTTLLALRRRRDYQLAPGNQFGRQAELHHLRGAHDQVGRTGLLPVGTSPKPPIGFDVVGQCRHVRGNGKLLQLIVPSSVGRVRSPPVADVRPAPRSARPVARVWTRPFPLATRPIASRWGRCPRHRRPCRPTPSHHGKSAMFARIRGGPRVDWNAGSRVTRRQPDPRPVAVRAFPESPGSSRSDHSSDFHCVDLRGRRSILLHRPQLSWPASWLIGRWGNPRARDRRLGWQFDAEDTTRHRCRIRDARRPAALRPSPCR